MIIIYFYGPVSIAMLNHQRLLVVMPHPVPKYLHYVTLPEGAVGSVPMDCSRIDFIIVSWAPVAPYPNMIFLISAVISINLGLHQVWS